LVASNYFYTYNLSEMNVWTTLSSQHNVTTILNLTSIFLVNDVIMTS